MILQALHDYYHRRVADPDPSRRLAALGREDKEIPFVLELTANGQLAGIQDTRTASGKKKIATRFLVPSSIKKTSGIAANLLWETAEYALGIADPKKLAESQSKGKEAEYQQRLLDMQAAFAQRIQELPASAQSDEGLRAVLAFVTGAPADAVHQHALGAEIAAANPVVTFRLATDLDLVCQRPDVAAACSAPEPPAAEEAPADGVCLITGQRAPVERLHAAIKGVWGAQTSGANIVSFNCDAFASFGKSQGANAPVSESATFAYTTALNDLLRSGSRQRMQVGDASAVFWAQKAEDTDMEGWFAEAFVETDNPDARTEQVRALLEAVRTGSFDGARGANRFFVLGLAPNAARIAVRFWHAAPLSEIAQRTREWFGDLQIDRSPVDTEYPSLFKLLLSTAVLNKADNIPPKLGGDLMRSILNGTPLPANLVVATLQRCRADQAKKTDTGKPVSHVNHPRAALLKASLNRLIRSHRLEGKEITVSLDLNNTEASYRLGRLFAAYERIQSDAAGRDLNRTIRDTYFGSAMSNPASVFPRLMQLNQHHLRDLKRSLPGLHTKRDRLLLEICNELSADNAFPSVQPLTERARFALGYYHQRQDFFRGPAADKSADTHDTPVTA